MKNSLTITAVAVVLIAIVSAATLFVLTAYAGQKSALDRCAKLRPPAARAVTDPAYGARLAELALCRASKGDPR